MDSHGSLNTGGKQSIKEKDQDKEIKLSPEKIDNSGKRIREKI